MKKLDPYIQEYAQLIGRTVDRIIVEAGVPEGEHPCYALHFRGGTVAWILQDEEGNGPGFLSIYQVPPGVPK